MNGAQEFTGQGFDSLGALLLHLLHILAQTALKGFIVLSSFIKMVLVHVIELENIFLKVKIITKEQYQVAHEFLVAENRFLQHFEDDLIGGEVDFRRLHRELLDDIKSKLMECADLCRNFEALIDTLLQFANGFAGVRNDDDFFGMDALFLHQVFHLGGHGGGFTRTGTCYQQAVVIISNDRTALLFIQLDHGINVLKDMVKIVLFLFQYTIHIVCIVGDHITAEGVHFGEERLQRVNIHPESTSIVAHILEDHLIAESLIILPIHLVHVIFFSVGNVMGCTKECAVILIEGQQNVA